ncbi:MAG: alpha-amylase family glycosyl hydrolase [Chlorobiales bacterium]
MQNRSPLNYHIYHAWDFNLVDPRLESPGYTFQTLIDSAHAKGIKVVLDVVLNHAGRFGIKHRAEINTARTPNLFIFGEVAQKRHELHQVELDYLPKNHRVCNSHESVARL